MGHVRYVTSQIVTSSKVCVDMKCLEEEVVGTRKPVGSPAQAMYTGILLPYTVERTALLP